MTEREPCPYRIADDLGGAFAMGLIGSSIFSSWRGFRTAPTGRVLRNMWREVSAKAPLRGAQFAAWGGTYSAFDCILASLRKKEDPLNSIASGFLTGTFLAARSGPAAALLSGAIGGVMLTAIETASYLFIRMADSRSDPLSQVHQT